MALYDFQKINKLINTLFYLDGKQLPWNHRQKVYPNGTLVTFPLQRRQDEGRYVCTARGSDARAGQASGEVNIRILGKLFKINFAS